MRGTGKTGRTGRATLAVVIVSAREAREMGLQANGALATVNDIFRGQPNKSPTDMYSILDIGLASNRP